jgi:hypothetical protein
MLNLDAQKLFKLARAFTEYSILQPKPKPNDYDDWQTFTEGKSKWEKALTITLVEVLSGKEPEKCTEIAVGTAFSLHDRRKQMAQYFRVLRSIGEKCDLGIDLQDRFLLPVKINAFVSPIYLLCGLLGRFEEDWQKMLRKFNEDNTPARREHLIYHHQLFTFYCWLQWGPSIPMCDCHCHDWKGEQRALQVGFGDENNSFPMFLGTTQRVKNEEAGAFEYLTESFLVDSDTKTFKIPTGGAKPRNFTVFPRCSLSNGNPNSGADQGPLAGLVNAQRHIMDPSMSSGIVLDYMNDDVVPKAEELPAYYSAYLWIMFVICDESGDPEYPAPDHPIPQDKPVNEQPYLGLIPFFEHANIADQGSLEVSMWQLATKVVVAFDKILERGMSKVNAFGGMSNSDNFKSGYIVYTCAFDHTGCVNDRGPASTFQLHDLRKKPKTLAGMVEAKMRATQKNYDRIIMDVCSPPPSISSEVHDNLIKSRDKFVSCRLPDVIEVLYH